MQGKTMERLGATLARSAKVAAVAAALLFSAPGTGEHASAAAAAAVENDRWRIHFGTWVLCLPIRCMVGTPYCCDMFSPPGPMM